MKNINLIENSFKIINKCYHAIILSIIIYIILLFTVGLRCPICENWNKTYNANDYNLYKWQSDLITASVSMFAVMIYLSLMKLYDISINNYLKEKVAIILTSIILYAFSLVSGLLILTRGSPILLSSRIRFPTIFWIDWIVSGPLIVYLATCSNYHINSSYQRYIHITTILFLYIFMLLYQFFNKDYIFSSLVILFIVLVILQCFLFFKRPVIKSGAIVPSSFQIYEQKNEELEWKTIRININRVLLYVCIPLLIIFLLELNKIVNYYEIYVAYSIVCKTTAINSITSTQLELIDAIRGQITSHITANESRKAFMKYVFHEIRNPLNSLTLGLDVINSSRKLTSSERETLDTMEESIHFMSNTLNDILSMHSIEDGEFRLIMREFNLKEVLVKAILSLKPEAEDKNIDISIDLTYLVPRTVYGDRVRIEMVIANFLAYIIKYSAVNKSILIIVSLQEEKSNNSNKSKVLFVIEDEEPGIKEDELKSLLQPFVKLRNDEVSLNKTNNGLGLALARDIIEMHGGSLFITKRSNLSMRIGFSIPFEVSSKNVSGGELIKCIRRKRAYSNSEQYKSDSIESRQSDNIQTIISEKPSRFTSALNSPSNFINHTSDYKPIQLKESNDDPNNTLTQLPLYTNNYEHSSKSEVSMITRDEQKQLEFKKCFLIVDDALSNRKILTMSLKKYNIDCDSAENGSIAVEKVKNETDKYTTIFMDYTMPIMNGAESTRLIRELGYKQLIFGLTGNALNDDVKRMLDAGVDIVLTKPLKPVILGKIITYLSINGSESKPNTKLILNGEDIELVIQDNKGQDIVNDQIELRNFYKSKSNTNSFEIVMNGHSND